MCGSGAKSVIFAFAWREADSWAKLKEINPSAERYTTSKDEDRIIWNDSVPDRSVAFDFGFYLSEYDLFGHATGSERTATNRVLFSTPAGFAGSWQKVVYCVTCESNDFLSDETKLNDRRRPRE